MSLEDPVVITCSISGAVADREQCPAIPYTPEEYAAEARRAVDEGASMIHIHARTPDGVPSYEIDDFRAITEAILGAVDDVIVNYSTGAIGVPLEPRLAYLRALRLGRPARDRRRAAGRGHGTAQPHRRRCPPGRGSAGQRQPAPPSRWRSAEAADRVAVGVDALQLHPVRAAGGHRHPLVAGVDADVATRPLLLWTAMRSPSWDLHADLAEHELR